MDAAAVAETARHCRMLEEQAIAELGVREGASDGVSIRWRAELRYAGQGFELPVDLPRAAGASGDAQVDTQIDVRAIRERFVPRPELHNPTPDTIRRRFVSCSVSTAAAPERKELNKPRITQKKSARKPCLRRTAPARDAFFARCCHLADGVPSRHSISANVSLLYSKQEASHEL
jgi:hypothetical protein